MVEPVLTLPIYCEACGRPIEPANKDDIEAGTANGAVFLHDNVPHTREQMDDCGYIH